MALYVVQAAGRAPAQLVEARFIPEGFSWPAFIYAQLWLLYHRLWLALAVWAVLEVAFFFLVFPHVGGPVSALIDGLAHLFIGFEGNRLRQDKGARRAALTEIVEARDRDEAETLFFRRHAPAVAPTGAAA
jgi:hypothetical protein